MARLQHSLDNAKGDPEKDFHLAFELNRIFERIEQTNQIDEDTEIELEEIESGLHISEIYKNIERWSSNNEFDAIREVRSLINDGITYAIDNNWQNVAAEFHHQLIFLQSSLSGHDADVEIHEALSFLNDNQRYVSDTIAIRLIDLIDDNLENVSDARKSEWVEFVQRAREQARSTDDFDTERSYLRRLHNLKTRYNEDTATIERLLIQTYRLEANWQSNNSLLMKADVLRSGINECGGFMDEATKESWKKEALEARKEGTEQEMAEFDLGNLPDSSYDGDLQKELNEEVRSNINTITDFFKDTEEMFDSTYALYCLLHSESLIPDTTRMRLNSEQFVLQQMISRRVMSSEYNSISIDPSDERSIPNNYQIKAISQMNATANALNQLMREGHLTAKDFINLFRASNSLSPNTEAFLTESLFDMFDGNHVQSLFVSLPHIEGAIVDTLSSIGKTIYANTYSGTEQQALGGLLIETDAFDEDFTTYLRYRYTSREGMNLRNRAAHGQLRYVNANYLNSVMAIYDICNIILEINPSAYLRVFGPPQRTISPSTNYGKDADLSLYTDLNRQIIGYGKSDDQHSLVVIRKDMNEDRTEVFIDKVKISAYNIGDADLTKKEIVFKIEDLAEEHAEIPADVDYEWLTDEKIIDDVMDIIEEFSDNDSNRVQKEYVFEQARTKGINESTARIALDQLEESGNINQDEDTVSLIS